MDIFIPIFIIFTIFVLCSLCGFCCKRQNEGAIFSTPVVITSQTHQPVGAPMAYPVQTGSVLTSYHTVVSPPSMPMPYRDSTAPYPTGPSHPMPGNAPYPAAPYGQQGGMPYPPQGGAYAPAASSPYPPQSAPYPTQQEMNPPPYNAVVENQSYQKQAPYNPNFSS